MTLSGGQKRNEEIAYFSLSAVNQVLIIMCLCMANTSWWRVDISYEGTDASEFRVGIWMECEQTKQTGDDAQCSFYSPKNDFHVEDVHHLNAARAFVIISMVVASLVLFYFLLELCGGTARCGKFCSRYGFLLVLLIQLTVICVACSLCQSFFNRYFRNYRMSWAAWLSWVSFILSALSTFASFLYLRYQDYW